MFDIIDQQVSCADVTVPLTLAGASELDPVVVVFALLTRRRVVADAAVVQTTCKQRIEMQNCA